MSTKGQWFGPREMNFSPVICMILLTWSDTGLIVVSLDLHLTDNTELDNTVACQIPLTGNLVLGTPQWPFSKFLRTP